MPPEHIADILARVLARYDAYSCFLPFEEPFNGDAGDAGPARELLGLDLALHGPVQHPVPSLPDEPRRLGEADPLFVHLARCGHSSHLLSVGRVNNVLNHRARILTTIHGPSSLNMVIPPCIMEMIDAKGFGSRIQRAIFDHQSQIGARYTQKDFGRDVGIAERGEPWGGTTVGEWIAERNEPSIATFKAMSYVTGKSIMWLMGIDELVLKPTSAKPAGVTEMPEMSETRLGQSEAFLYLMTC